MATEKEGQSKDEVKDPLAMTDKDMRKFFEKELANIPSPEEPALEVDAEETGGDPEEGKKDTTPSAPEGEPAETEPTEDATAELMKQVPEQFRSKDFADTLTKITDGWEEMQSSLSKRDKEVDRLNKALRAQQMAAAAPRPAPKPAPQRPMPAPQPQQYQRDPAYAQQDALTRPDPIEEPDAYQQWMDSRYADMNQQMLTDFATNIGQAWDANLTNQLSEYDKKRQLSDEFNRFRQGTEDFDDHRNDMVRVLEEHPYLNEQPGAISTVYELAKERSAGRMGRLREDVKPEGYDDLKKAIVVIGREIGKINQRATDERQQVAKKTASGTGGSTGPVQTKERLSPEEKRELDEDEALWQTIISSNIGGDVNEGDTGAADLLNLQKFAKPITRVKGEL